MAAGVITAAGQIALNSEGISGPTWLGAVLALLTAGDLSDPNAVWSLMTEANFMGYTRRPIAWGAVSWDTSRDLVRIVQTQTEQWSGPADGSGQQIIGWAILQAGGSGSGGASGGPLLLAACELDESQGLIIPTDLLAIVAELDNQGATVGTTV